MKNLVKSTPFIFTVLCACSLGFTQSRKPASEYIHEAEVLIDDGNYRQAAHVFEDFIAAEKTNPQSTLDTLGVALAFAGHCYARVGQYDTAIRYYEDAVDILEIVEITDLIVTVRKTIVVFCSHIADEHLDKAREFMKNGDYAEAAQLFEESARAERVSPLPRLIALGAALSNAGVCYHHAHEYNKAVIAFEKALSVAVQLEATDKIIEMQNGIAYVYDSWGQYERAIIYYEKSLAIERELDREGEVARMLNIMGLVLQSMHRFDEAINYYQESLVTERKLNREVEIAKVLYNMGSAFLSKQLTNKALEYYNEALKIEKKLGNENEIAKSLNGIGLVYEAMGHFDKAINYLEESLTLAIKLGKDGAIATSLNNVGLLYSSAGLYEKAIENFEKAIILDKKLKREDKIAIRLNNIGLVYDSKAEFDRAIEFYEKALTINRKLNKKDQIAVVSSNTGQIYMSWGKYEQAIKYFKEALAIDRELGREGGIAIALNNIGSVYYLWGRHNQALEYFQKAQVFFETQQREGAIAAIKNNLSQISHHQKNYVQAIAYLEEALQFYRKQHEPEQVATVLGNLSNIYQTTGQYKKAIELCNEALLIAREFALDEVATALHANLGLLYYDLIDYAKATEHFEIAANLIETIRKTARGAAKRDYLARMVNVYQFLITIYLEEYLIGGDLQKSYHNIGLSRARLLSEQLADSESQIVNPAIAQVQRQLQNDAVLLLYANANWQHKVLITITHEATDGRHISHKRFVDSVQQKYRESFKVLVNRENAIERTGAVKKDDDFAQIVNYYRHLLREHSLGDIRNVVPVSLPRKVTDSNAAWQLSRGLYDLLIAPISKFLVGKTRLVIIPDGVLNLIPFETLIDENGQYLVEKFDITYAPAVGVLELLKQRRYDVNRRPLLAFGGAMYDANERPDRSLENDRQLAFVLQKVDEAFSTHRSLRNEYASLGIGSLKNLPGTLREVQSIKEIVNGAEIIIGKQVTEKKLKTLSQSGELARYKVIHFATHGLVVPEIPELSAIVLSQSAEMQNDEDGFLNVREISKLKLQADFVNLSACETGLGKLYAGEGVVGLTHAFLIAGANGLSVSLWQVADESTAKFMVELYRLVENEGKSYPQALSRVKHRFIRGEFGDKYKAPFYWAPFVYYGR